MKGTIGDVVMVAMWALTASAATVMLCIDCKEAARSRYYGLASGYGFVALLCGAFAAPGWYYLGWVFA